MYDVTTSTAEWISTVAAAVTALVAVSALVAWRYQHRSKAQEKLSHAILKTVYRIQDLLEDARDPGFTIQEFDGWYEKYREQSSELRSLVHESNIYWGNTLNEVAKAFWEARHKMTEALRHRKHDEGSNTKDARFTEADNQALSEVHNKEIRKLVWQFEHLLGDKYIR